MRRATYERAKRLIDIGAGAAGLLMTLPLQSVVAALVAVRLGRPVLFRQVRPGRDGRLFTLVKFRTMRPASATDPLPDADRLTTLGRLLRAASLDELPTLWNVLQGDMSLVGPRPLLVEYLPLYTPEQRRRHEVRSGITGLAQVSGRNALAWPERLALDAAYVDARSARLDLVILLRTVGKVLRRDGITAEGHATVEKLTRVGAA